MARAGINYAREPAFPVRKAGRSSTDSSRPHLRMKGRTPSSTSGMDNAWTISDNDNVNLTGDRDGDAGQAPLQSDVDTSQISTFPEYFDQSHSYAHAQSLSNSPDSKRKGSGSMRSTKFSARTPIDSNSTWHLDSTHLMSASANESSEGLEYRSQHSQGQTQGQSQRAKPIKPKVHIKPILRKMSRDDAPSTSIDLSRSSTEQEGLGIYMNFERDRRQSDSFTGVTYRRTPAGLHHRSTSGASQLSSATGSSGGKPAASQYVYPMRPTPRAYTPELSQSYQTSANDSDGLEEEDDDGLESVPASQTPSVLENQGQHHHRTNRASSGPMPRLSLQIEDDSFTRLSGISQTNISSRPSFGYSRDNGSTLDTASPTSRPSLDFVFKSRTRTSTDPVSRAATVQAARQAFEAKEAAKNRRFEKQQIKAEERKSRRRVKRTKSESPDSPAISPAIHSTEEINEKATYTNANANANSNTNEKQARPQPTKSEQPSASWKSQSKSTWVLFMTWLRTRVFKFQRKLRKS